MLADARHRAGLSARVAATRTGVHRRYLLRLEAAERCPSAVVAAALADVLGLTADERVLLADAALPGVGYGHPLTVRRLRPAAG